MLNVTSKKLFLNSVKIQKKYSSLVATLVFLVSSIAFAGNTMPSTFTYQGRLINSSGTSALTGNLTLYVEIYNPSKSCLLYSEHQAITTADGTFSIQVGAGTRTSGVAGYQNDPSYTLTQIFHNTIPFGAIAGSCPAGYTPATNDGRILVLNVVDSSSTTTTMADQNLTPVPQALVADSLDGVGINGFVQSWASDAARPTNPTANVTVGWNINRQKLEMWNGASWVEQTPKFSASASNDAAADGQVLKWNAALTQWEPADASTLITLAGDVTGAPGANTVSKLQNYPLDLSTAPNNNQVLTWNGTKWLAANPAVSIVAGNGTANVLSKFNGSGGLLNSGVSDDGSTVTISEPVSMSTKNITNLANPVNPQDAATKNYVDTQLGANIPTGATTGQLMMWNQAGPNWTVTSNTAPANGNFLKWNGTTWIPTNLAAGDIPNLTQYVRVDGTTPLTANWGVGGFDITNVGNITQASGKSLGLSPIASAAAETTLTSGWNATQKGYAWFRTDTNTVRYWDGAAAQSLGVAGSGLQSIAADTTNAQTLSVGATSDASHTAPAWVNNGTGDHLINIPMASVATTTAGLISNADYAKFNGTTSLTDNKLWVGNSANVPVAVNASGDVTTTDTGSFTVTGIRGKTVDPVTLPTVSGQVYSWNNTASKWVVSKASAQADGQLLRWNNINTQYEPTITTIDTSGNVLLPGAPSSNLMAADKAYVDAAVTGMQTTTLANGQIWVGNSANVAVATTLASGQILVGNASSIATPISVSGDTTMSATGVSTVTGLNGKALDTAATINKTGQLYFWNNTASKWQASDSTAAPTNGQVLTWDNANSRWTYSTPTTGTVTGTGTINTVTKWANTTGGLTNSAITENGTQVSTTSDTFNVGNSLATAQISLNSTLFIHEGNGTNDVFIGPTAGNTTTTSTDNTAIGQNSLHSVTSGSFNAALGQAALFSNTTGLYNTAAGSNMNNNTTGSYNTALGQSALVSNVGKNGSTAVGYQSMYYADSTATASTTYNTAIGYQSLMGSSTAANNTGTNNTALGATALYSNTNGSSNTATGVEALYSNTTGGNNTAGGVYSLSSNTTGSSNTANGVSALASNTTGGSNTAVGLSTLGANTTGINNTGLGANALMNNVGKTESTAVGYFSMLYADNTTTATVTYNTALGAYSLEGSSTAASNTGTYNTAVGHSAMKNNTSGSDNIAIGALSLYSNTTGLNNLAIGAGTTINSTLYSNTIGNQNVAVGNEILNFTSTSSNNTAVGFGALELANDPSSGNVAIGASALGNMGSTGGSGSNNTAIGYGAGGGVGTSGTASGNVFIGYNAGPNSNISNKLYINNASGTPLIYGDFAAVKVGIGTTNPGATLDVSGHIANSQATSPTFTGCGTAPAFAAGSNDTRGEVIVGTGGTLTCQINFATAFATTPFCIVSSNDSSTLGSMYSTATTSALTVHFTISVASSAITYICMQ